MGAYQSKLTPEEVEELQSSTHCPSHPTPLTTASTPSPSPPSLLPSPPSSPLLSPPPPPPSSPSVSVTSREIEDLYRRFKKLDRKRAGYITREELYLVPELSMNPLCDRIIALFDPAQSEQVTFDMFVQTVNLFSPRAPLMDRMRAVFAVYDVDGDGRISAADLHALLHLLVGDNIDADTQRAIVEQTLHDCGKRVEEALSIDECARIIGADVATLIIPVRTSDI